MRKIRVIGLAYKNVSLDTERLTEELTKELVFVGLVDMKDPPRPGVKEAIKKARKAGIRVIMKTGDHQDTALSIAKEIGLITEKEQKESRYPSVLSERELEGLNEKELDLAVKHVSIFARLTPHTKLKILESLQRQGFIVAMTGDGVNRPGFKKSGCGNCYGSC